MIYRSRSALLALLLHTRAWGSIILFSRSVCPIENYGSVEQLVTGRKNLTSPPLWISCLCPSFVIPNWVPYIPSLGRFWHVNVLLRALKHHNYSEMLQGLKMVPWDAPFGEERGRRKHKHKAHHRLKCAFQSGIMLMVEPPSGHQTVLSLIELFTDDMGSHHTQADPHDCPLKNTM